MAEVAEYACHGLALVAIPRGRKGPVTTGWNRRDSAITDPAAAAVLQGNVGLAHAYCTPAPTMALDIDDLALAKAWLAEHDIDLDALLDADDAVQVVSGRSGRAKLLYRLPAGTAPLTSHVISGGDPERTILEFRCASQDGLTLQDVLPPSTHPDTGMPYLWAGKGDWSEIPEIPAELLMVWKSARPERRAASISGVTISKAVADTPQERARVADMLRHVSADCAYDQYRNIVWAILSLGWNDAELLAREWCMTVPDQFDEKSFDSVVASFDKKRSQTIGTIHHHARQAGWVPLTINAPSQPALVMHGITAQALSLKQFAPLNWVIPDILPEGCYLLTARPKVGKSWLGLQVSLAVALGLVTLGKQACQGKAVYLALEDNQRRLKDRLQQLRPQGYATPDLLLYTTWPRFDAGGLDALRGLIEKEQPKLIVIDTLAKVRPGTTNSNVYENDYKALAPLTELANQHRCSIVVIHHNRKGKSDVDALEQISGSLGLVGAVDGALVIDGVRSDKQYKLSLIGRDIPSDDELAIRLRSNGEWEVLGIAHQVFVSAERKQITDLLFFHPKGLKPREIADHLGKGQSATRKLLMSMVGDQQVSVSRGAYSLPIHIGNGGSSVGGNTGNGGNA